MAVREPVSAGLNSRGVDTQDFSFAGQIRSFLVFVPRPGLGFCWGMGCVGVGFCVSLCAIVSFLGSFIAHLA